MLTPLHNKIFQRLKDIFHQNSFDNIKTETSKLRTYALFKNEIGFEKYLTEIKNVSDRIQIAKFRLSNHRLMIEVGRHNRPKTPPEERFCPFCPDLVESECHFMFSCPTYTHLRARYLRPITVNIRSFNYLPHDGKIRALLTNLEYDTAKFIVNSMELRNF